MGINHNMLKKEIPWTCSLAAVMFNDLIQVCPKESGNTCTSANPLVEKRFPCSFPWQTRRMRWINWDQSSVSAWAFLLLDLIDRNPVHICQPYSFTTESLVQLPCFWTHGKMTRRKRGWGSPISRAASVTPKWRCFNQCLEIMEEMPS